MLADGEPSVSRGWQPITDLPENRDVLVVSDVQSLAAIWQARREILKESPALKQFDERLAREWAIETGIIEGLYTIDRGTTQVLIEQGIIASLIPHGSTDKPAGRIVDILKDHQVTLDGILDFIGRQRELSTSYIKEVHAALTQHQLTTEALDALGQHREVPLIRGDWKQQPNSPTRPDGNIHSYCPPEHVAAEMDRLVEWHKEHETKGVTSEVEAAWLHHRFTQIHPFQDGNGRVARVLASLVFLRAGWFPLVIHRNDRASYISALETADTGDLSELVSLFAKIQKQAMWKAISLSASAGQEKNLTRREQILEAIDHKLLEKQKEKPEDWEVAINFATKLNGKVYDHLDALQKQLNQKISASSDNSSVVLEEGKFLPDIYLNIAEEIAQDEGYAVDTTSYATHVTLRFTNPGNVIGIIFHGIGPKFIGVLVAVGFFGVWKSGRYEVTSIAQEPFQIAYNENESDLLARFELWLNATVDVGLREWLKRL